MSKDKHQKKISKAAEELASEDTTKKQKSKAGKILKEHQDKQH